MARQGRRRDIRQHLRPVARITAAQVGVLACGVGADDQEIGTRAQVAVAGAGRDQDGVAGPYLESGAVL